MQNYDFLLKIDRRKFLKVLSLTGIGGLIYPNELISSILPNALTRVIIVEDKTATSGNTINNSTVQVMIDSGIKSLAQNSNISDAWKTIFPNISTTTKIALKVNCINSSLSTHPEIALAVANSIREISLNGTAFPENNIIIYDRTTSELRNAKYTINTSGTGIRCFATDASGVGYSTQTFSIAGSTQKLSKIVTDMTDFLINISVLKNHSMSGVTGCLKNHYGTCNSPGSLHNTYCDPAIPMLNATQPIMTKQKLNICDALYGIKSGGPDGAPQFIANKILLCQDIVAIDYNIRKLLADNGCTTTKTATHIDTAAKTYNLGVNDPAKMDIINILNPTLGVEKDKNGMKNITDYILEQNYPNPFNNSTVVRFSIPASCHVNLTVFDGSGKEVFELINKKLDAGMHEISWNGINDKGRMVSSGIYLCELKAGNYKKAIIMQLIK
jgi:uncharacterized protein (DUF362 family)